MRIRIFLISILLSMPLWWSVNSLASAAENLFFNFTTINERAFKAAVSLGFEEITRENNFGELQITAKAAGSVLILPNGEEIAVFRKNTSSVLPIASLTKLMAADIVLENFALSKKIEIKPEILKEDIYSIFKLGETFVLKDLLSSALIESNNSAVRAIAELIGEKPFVDLMNLEAKYLGMAKTNFSNSTGLDSKDIESELINLSTVQDLTKLVKHLLKKPELLEIISQKEFKLYTFNGDFHHNVITTNEFLKADVSFGNKEIIGAKTGQTEKAGECLILIFKIPKKDGFLISIVLGSDDRFGDMEKMINWVSKTYEL